MLFPAALLFNITCGLAGFGIISYARDVFHASAGQIGWLAAVPQLAYLAGCLAFPPLFGLFQPRHYLLAATGALTLLLAGLLAARGLSGLFVLYGLSGFLISLFWPPLMGWLSRGLEAQPLARTLRRGPAAGAGPQAAHLDRGRPQRPGLPVHPGGLPGSAENQG